MLTDTRIADRGPIEETLLENVVADTDGVWKPTQRRAPIHIAVEGVAGAFTGTVTLYGTLQRERPADSDNFRIVLQATTDTALSFSTDIPYAWVKAQVTGYAGGTIFSGLVAGS